MSNIVDFTRNKKTDKSKVQIDPLERAKQLLTPKKPESKPEFVKRVKGILSSQGVKYRISHKEISESDYPKSQSILFPEHKLAFIISENKIKIKRVPSGWTIESIQLDNKIEAIDYAAQIISKIKEYIQNVTKKAQV